MSDLNLSSIDVRERERPRVQKFFMKPSMTKQSFKAECDINTIMKKYEKTGLISHVAKHNGRYGDFLAAPDYLDAMVSVVQAQEAFSTLPAALRKRFGNDPAEFLDFVSNPANEDEMRKLGLLKPLRPVDDVPASTPAGDTKEPTQEGSSE